MILTQGTLLGGRVRYAQPAQGFRSGIEPVLLAAAVPVRAGQTVLEGGTGAGAALLCLLHRVPGAAVVGIERDAAMAVVARANLTENGFFARVTETDVLGDAEPGPVDHACANPPYHDAAGTAPIDPGRRAAKVADDLPAWIAALARRLRRRGTLTLVLPARLLPHALAAMGSSGLGTMSVLPLWPRQDRPAKLLLIQAIRGGRGAARVLPGLVLHGPEGRFTPAAEAILRDGQALILSA